MENFPTCPARTRLTLWAANGEKSHVWRCTAQEAEKANQNVVPADCTDCPVRRVLVRDVKRHVPATKRPPRDHRAALAADKGGDGFPDCQKRLFMEIKPTCSSCSKPVKMRICGEDKSPYFEGTVSPENCSSCPFRTAEDRTR